MSLFADSDSRAYEPDEVSKDLELSSSPASATFRDPHSQSDKDADDDGTRDDPETQLSTVSQQETPIEYDNATQVVSSLPREQLRNLNRASRGLNKLAQVPFPGAEIGAFSTSPVELLGTPETRIQSEAFHRDAHREITSDNEEVSRAAPDSDHGDQVERINPSIVQETPYTPNRSYYGSVKTPLYSKSSHENSRMTLRLSKTRTSEQGPEPVLNNCVFVKWHDAIMYPAQVKSRGAFDALARVDGAKVTVLFGGDEEGEVSPKDAYPLDLMENDRVIYQKDMKVYHILECLEETEESTPKEPRIVTDSGCDRLIVQAKRGAKYVGKKLQIYLNDIILDNALFASYRLRREGANLKQPVGGLEAIREASVLINGGVGGSPTSPNSKRIRTDRIIQSGRPQKQRKRHSSRLFEGCVFALTMAEHECNHEVMNAINENGGIVLEKGITDLLQVDFESMEISAKHSLKEFKFGAVIAAQPLRTPKYYEALAIGWPCLSHNFILECVGTATFLDEWKPYLLSAGESLVLQSPVSYNVDDFELYWNQDRDLHYQFQRRRLPLGSLASPVYLLARPHDGPVRLLLMLVTSRPPRVVNSLEEAPPGSIVVDADKNHVFRFQNDSCTRYRLSSRAVLPETVVFSREWLLQCIINQRLV